MDAKSSPIKIVHVTTIPETLLFLAGSVGYMMNSGFEVAIISSPGDMLDQFAETEHVETFAVPMLRAISPLQDLRAIWKLWRVLRKVRPHIVDAKTPKAGLLGMIASWFARVPVRVYQMHGLPMSTAHGLKRCLLRMTEKVSCRLATQVLSVSPSVMQLALQEGLCPASKIKALLNGSLCGIDAEGAFNPARVNETVRSEIRARLGIPRDAFVVGFVGRLVCDKGVIELADAFRDLLESDPNLHLIVIGVPEVKDAVPEEVIRYLTNHERIHITGLIDRREMPEYLSATDLMVLPTYREGFPTVVMEACAMALPVVATRVTGCVDAVIDGVTGILVPPYDAPALADAIRRYINDPSLCRRHGQAGRERMLRDFRQEDIWNAICREYARLLRRRGLPVPAAFDGEKESTEISSVA